MFLSAAEIQRDERVWVNCVWVNCSGQIPPGPTLSCGGAFFKGSCFHSSLIGPFHH